MFTEGLYSPVSESYDNKRLIAKIVKTLPSLYNDATSVTKVIYNRSWNLEAAQRSEKMKIKEMKVNFLSSSEIRVRRVKV